MAKAKIMLRPTIEANSVEIGLTALRKYRDSTVLDDIELTNISNLISVLAKELIKIESGRYGSYIKQGTKAPVNLTLEDFGGDSSSINSSKTISDKDKIAAMSEEESAAFWAEQEAALLGSISNAISNPSNNIKE